MEGCLRNEDLAEMVERGRTRRNRGEPVRQGREGRGKRYEENRENLPTLTSHRAG